MNYVESRTDNANYHLVQLDGRTYDIKPSTGTVLLASDPRVRLDGSDTQLRTTSPLQFKIEGDSSAVSYDVDVDRTSLVQWGAKRDATSNQITLHLKEGPLSQAAHALLIKTIIPARRIQRPPIKLFSKMNGYSSRSQ